MVIMKIRIECLLMGLMLIGLAILISSGDVWKAYAGFLLFFAGMGAIIVRRHI